MKSFAYGFSSHFNLFEATREVNTPGKVFGQIVDCGQGFELNLESSINLESAINCATPLLQTNWKGKGCNLTLIRIPHTTKPLPIQNFFHKGSSISYSF